MPKKLKPGSMPDHRAVVGSLFDGHSKSGTWRGSRWKVKGSEFWSKHRNGFSVFIKPIADWTGCNRTSIAAATGSISLPVILADRGASTSQAAIAMSVVGVLRV